ncbi:32905_t:CDS:2, partial [Gigaspora margarita]
VVENLPIVVNKAEIYRYQDNRNKDYAVIVGANWLNKVKWRINLAKEPISLEQKSRVSSEEIDKEENEEEYEFKEVKEKRSYIVQDKLPIIEIKRNTISIKEKEADIETGTIYWYKKWLNCKEESCIKCEELFKNIETLECLVNNLDEELEIFQDTRKYYELEKNQQAKVDELMENNKDLFVKGLIQLGRMKKE